MNNERYKQIIDEAYGNYKRITELSPHLEYLHQLPFFSFSSCTGVQHLTKLSYIQMCKIDSDFSERWGLKIEERELSLEERYEIRCKKENIRNDWEQFYSTFGGYKNEMDSLKKSLNDNNIPLKQITVTYQENKIEVYE
jgi:hypothetical protein